MIQKQQTEYTEQLLCMWVGNMMLSEKGGKPKSPGGLLVLARASKRQGRSCSAIQAKGCLLLAGTLVQICLKTITHQLGIWEREEHSVFFVVL